MSQSGKLRLTILLAWVAIVWANIASPQTPTVVPQLAPGGAGGSFHEWLCTAFTASGTLIWNGRAPYVTARLVGGGGAGGGAPSDATNASIGSGGGGGEDWSDTIPISGNLTVTLGAGGAGVSGADGNLGANSTIVQGATTLMTARGGGNGWSALYNSASSLGTPSGGSAGGRGATGGQGGLIFTAIPATFPRYGAGGSSLGPGANPRAATAGDGISGAANTGAGGSGAVESATATNRTGGSGGSGYANICQPG